MVEQNNIVEIYINGICYDTVCYENGREYADLMVYPKLQIGDSEDAPLDLSEPKRFKAKIDYSTGVPKAFFTSDEIQVIDGEAYLVEQNKEQEIPKAFEPTKDDIVALFYCLVKQNQDAKAGNIMSFDKRMFKCLPKSLQMSFCENNGRIEVRIPETPSKRNKKSRLSLPSKQIIVTNEG